MIRRDLVDKSSRLSVRKQCDLLSVSRGSIYYVPKGEKPENLEIMRLMDEHILEEGYPECSFIWLNSIK